MQVLMDTNVVLDVLLQREPWYKTAAIIWQAADEKHIVGYVTACALTDVFYIAKKIKGSATARTAVSLCLEAFEICPVVRETLTAALTLPGRDFEDNVQIACASLAGLDAIITRDAAGFQAAPLPAFTPTTFVEQFL